MTLDIFYFAVLRDLVGKERESVTVELSPPTVAELVSYLLRENKSLSMEGVRVAVNEEFVALDHPLASGDVVALIPPVSGG